MLESGISFAFYIFFSIYFFIGVYGLSLNKKEKLNRVFFLMCMGFATWAFAFCVGNSAETLEVARIWRRISTFGWGITYSFILHFSLTLARSERFLKSPFALWILYLPAAVNVLSYAVFPDYIEGQYILEHTAAGWASLPTNNFWDVFFNVYYIVFSLATILALGRWYFKTDSKVEKKYASSIIISFGISLVLGTLTDILANRFLTMKLPSLAPIIIIIPVITIYYVIHKYGLMAPKIKRAEIHEGVILSGDNRGKLFRYITLCLFIGSFANLALHIIKTLDWQHGIFLSALMTVLGSFISVLPVFIRFERNQDRFFMYMMAALIPIILFTNLDIRISNVFWAIPLFFIMTTTIFNNPRMLQVIGFVSIASGIGLWIFVPKAIIRPTGGDYFYRMLFYVIGMALVYYILQIFIQRLQENERQAGFQRLVAEVSTDFVTITNTNIDEKIENLLERCARYFGSGTGYLARFSEDRNMVSTVYMWKAESGMVILDGAGDEGPIYLGDYPWFRDRILENKMISIGKGKGLPDVAVMEIEKLREIGTQSLEYIPILIGGKVVGLLGFDEIISQKKMWVEDQSAFRMLTSIFADAMVRLESEQEITLKAYYDGLTGLPNKALFVNRLDQGIHLARRNENLIGVVYIDLDGFKIVNDTLGHDWGDNLLRQVGNKMKNSIRKYDTISRIGGDEFLLMLPNINSPGDIEEIVKKIMKYLREPIFISGKEFFISASFGISVFPQDGNHAEELIKHADMAMYYAKNNGKNQYAFCGDEMVHELEYRNQIASSLQKAFDENELYLEYQPIRGTGGGEILGVEALLRWNHPKLGGIYPRDIISIAEQTGLIRPLGDWIVQKASAQNKAWQDQGLKPIRMSVNVSPGQFHGGELYSSVMKALERTGLHAEWLEIEITEELAMNGASDIEETLRMLKLEGVHIAIDDFGKEYSSLSRIKELPIDRVKMDMQFVHGISVNKKDESIVSVIIHLAKSLGLRVTAEGVERSEQLEFLRKEKCDDAQGFYFERPVSSASIEALLKKQPHGQWTHE